MGESLKRRARVLAGRRLATCPRGRGRTPVEENRMKKLVAISAALLAAALLTYSTIAQQGPPPQNPGGQGGPPRGQGRGPGIEALAMDDHTGFEAIFDGKTL